MPPSCNMVEGTTPIEAAVAFANRVRSMAGTRTGRCHVHDRSSMPLTGRGVVCSESDLPVQGKESPRGWREKAGMHVQPGRWTLLLCLLFLVAACSSGPTRARDTQVMYDRMVTRLAFDLAAGRVKVQRLPHEVRVTLVEEPLFVPGEAELNEAGRDLLTRLIQAMVEPELLRIATANTAAPPATLEAARAEAVLQYLAQPNLAAAFQPQQGAAWNMSPHAVPASAQGLTIMVRVVAG